VHDLKEHAHTHLRNILVRRDISTTTRALSRMRPD
jgi:hypothetical protein